MYNINRRIKSKKVFFILLIMCLFFTSCTSSKTEKNNNEIRIAYFPNITHAQALVIKNQKTFENELGSDYSVKWTAFNAGTDEIEALFAGEIDLGYIGPTPAISGYVKSKGDLKIIAGASNGGAVLVKRGDVKLDSIKELDGLTVAVPSFGNTQHLCLLDLLQKNDLKPLSEGGTVNIVQSSNADIMTLMDNKKIDAALVPEPWGSILEINLGAEVVIDYNDIENEAYSTAVVIASQDFLSENPEIVKKFLKVHEDATLYINNNIEDAKKIVNSEIETATQKPIDEDVLNVAFSRLSITSDIPKESIQKFAQISKNAKIIDKVPDENIIDSSFLDTLETAE